MLEIGVGDIWTEKGNVVQRNYFLILTKEPYANGGHTVLNLRTGVKHYVVLSNPLYWQKVG